MLLDVDEDVVDETKPVDATDDVDVVLFAE